MKNQAGLTLIEVVVSIGALTVILSALTIATLSSLNNSTYSKNQNLATQYAQAALEGVRQANDAQTVDASGNRSFQGYSGSYCYPSTCSTFDPSTCAVPISGPSDSCAPDTTMFKRVITIVQSDTLHCGTNPSGGGGAYVTATTAWTDGKCTSASFCQKVVLSSCLAAPAGQQLQ